MWRNFEWVLGFWTAGAICWWILALALLSSRQHRLPRNVAGSGKKVDRATLSVFKPLAGLRCKPPCPDLVAAIESFVTQLDDRSELLLGIEEVDHERWQPVLDRWKQQYPEAKLKVVCVPRPATFLSPKVSWYHRLAEDAEGELWMWSDADVIAPPGFLRAARQELAASGATLVTCPYVIRRNGSAPALLEALFVNAEFYPGVLACSVAGKVRFAFGAGLLFSAEEFRRRIQWEELGARMADDFLIGKKLAPVEVSGTTVETLPAETRWKDALLHYLRWHKTVRWNRPGSYACQLIVMPVLGWLAAVVWHPHALWPWVGLVLTVQLEALAAWVACRKVGCRLELRYWWTLKLWSVLRALTWLACWLPWPVVFRSQNRVWWSLYRCTGGHA